MKILRAETLGFCFGVRRAFERVERMLADGAGELVTLGPLIHNPQEVARLARLGVRVVDSLLDCLGRRALVRTHGIGREQLEQATRMGIELVDATCPHVKTARRKLVEFGHQGRTVLLVGDRDHPEVQAQLSYFAGPVLVIGDPAELPDLPTDTPIGLVAQTTLAQETFARACQALTARFPDALVADTICQDARLRQQASRELAARVDLVIVVGGKNSSNTSRLAEICRAVQPRTLHVECAADLAGLDLDRIERVGLTSGASTPDWLIDEVERALLAEVLAGG